jgi:putative ABC transport system ATP-binding protein
MGFWPMAYDSGFAVEAFGLTRTYGGLSQGQSALRDVSLNVDHGEVVAIMGPSGSGKSTLLFILAGLDLPDAGHVKLAGSDWTSLVGSARAQFRRRNCGFIAQGLSLLPQATAAENVEVPLLLDGIDSREHGRRVSAALDRVGLSGLAGSLTDELSGGEQQRVAIARALVLCPAVVLADEPTGSLDSVTAQIVVKLLVEAAVEQNTAVVLVTHDPAVAQHAHRIVTMRSGLLT